MGPATEANKRVVLRPPGTRVCFVKLHSLWSFEEGDELTRSENVLYLVWSRWWYETDQDWPLHIPPPSSPRSRRVLQAGRYSGELDWQTLWLKRPAQMVKVVVQPEAPGAARGPSILRR